MRTKISRSLLIVVIVLLSAIGMPVAHPSAAATPPAVTTGDGSLLFVENVGQFDERARFQVRSGVGTIWLADDAIWLSLAESIEGSESPTVQPRQLVNLKLSFPGANPHPRLEPFNRQETVIHYYRGSDPSRWRTDVPVWGGARYVDLYPGIDLEVSGVDGRWTWRLMVHDSQFDIANVRLLVEGSEAVTTRDGYLHLTTPVGHLALPLLTVAGNFPASALTVTRETGGAFEIAAPFFAASPGDVRSLQAAYPEEAYFGSYLGGDGDDWVSDIAVGGQGDILNRDYEFASGESRSIWVVGRTTSTDFPDKPGGTSLSGASDVFVTKLKRVATLVKPVYSAYIGGDAEDAGAGITLDDNDNVYIVGWTMSPDFPTTGNAFEQTFNACVDCVQCNYEMDGFMMKMDSSGNLLYSTYLGGSYFYTPGYGNVCGYDSAAAIAVNAQGIAYITGKTRSDNFPTTSGAYDTDFSYEPIGLNDDTFIVKLNPAVSGSAGLLYGTFIGGGTFSAGQDIAVDKSGNAYVTGYATGFQNLNYFPTTPGAYSGGINRGSKSEAFILKLNPGGNGSADLLYSTFLGTSTGTETGEGIALDASNTVYVVGSTDSPGFPTTGGAFDTTCGDDGNCNTNRSDAFITRLNPGGNGAADLLYSTFLGGMYEDRGHDIALGSGGDVYVTGKGGGTGFPVTPDAYDTIPGAYFTAFVSRLRFQGNGADDLVYSTIVKGSLNDEGIAITLDEDNRVYVAGETLSNDFPTTAHAFDRSFGSIDQKDAFVFRLLTPPTPNLSTSTKTVSPDKAAAGQVVTFTVQLVNSGVCSATARFTDTLPTALLLHGSPTASSGAAPGVNGQTITWSGTVTEDTTVLVTYATMLTSTTTITPTAVNQALIDDGRGNVYLRRAFVNGCEVFLPLILKHR